MFNGKMGVTAATWIATLISLQSNASGSDETIKAYDIAKKVWVDVMNGGMDSSSQNLILKDVTKLKKALSDELIIDSLNDHYGIEAIGLPFLAGRQYKCVLSSRPIIYTVFIRYCTALGNII